MGAQINKNGKPYTILINKARANDRADYDDIADAYNELFEDDESKAENDEAIKLLGYNSGMSVLDVGCGQGLLLDYISIEPKLYLGVDPSAGMLKIFEKKHPGYKTVQARFEEFYSKEKYDLIVGMFGAPSYIEPTAIERMHDMLTTNGKAVLMFYKPGYRPVTYDLTGKTIQHYEFEEYGRSGKVFNKFMVVEIRRKNEVFH